MTLLSIDTRRLNALRVIFTPGTTQRILEITGRRIGAAAESIVPEYPPPSGKPLPKRYQRTRADGSTYLSKFKSRAQQGKVFALLSENKIPYRRTGMLGRSVVSALTELTGTSVTVSVGSALPYAPLVIGGDEQQAQYHRGHWWQLETAITGNLPVISAAGQAALNEAVERALRGDTL
jgi:hypothetical protein